ncbi:Gfo/Idh/MocA family protein [Sanguibacter suaedae]|uniref:Gfo/Idh/MocA family oxidoreductase n=1 Tax=Sanguibacter suaedae TaxID=2795737 RepID=A0A934M8S7_9MICO|nr:Gfo/Idh/MocA family oxidoreductase [Sanguibacter suaedae]MBI9113875.1 Gfo/Idh/MocA family oxidoreductase [Sanguibacter suaedae]
MTLPDSTPGPAHAADDADDAQEARVPACRRYAVAGLGNRAEMYVEAVAGAHADVAELVAWCEPNPVRAAYYDARAAELGISTVPLPRYDPADLERMVAEQRVDVVIVTTPDHTHADVAARAMRAGADVVVEKPLTTDLAGARIFEEVQTETGRDLTVTFNYRYSPRNSTLKEVVASGEIGEVTSVHFEWVLDTRHGADYFRRWHRLKENSGGLLVHKSSHHFDLVNWWLDDLPTRVFASGGLRFYGPDAAARRGLGERPARGTGEHAATDPFALDLRDDPRLRDLYLEAEGHDGYLRDLDVFSGPITIEDNLAVVVDYERGATLTYSLNAHGPWEGYTVAVNGTAGRAELTVVERTSVPAFPGAGDVLDASAHEDKGSVSRGPAVDAGPGAARVRGNRLVVQQHWGEAREVPVVEGAGGHGGGDAKLLAHVFRGVTDDPLGLHAGPLDGFRSLAVGIAANRSLRSGTSERVEHLGLQLR